MSSVLQGESSWYYNSFTLAGQPVSLDGRRSLLSWIAPQDAAYGTVLKTAWERLLTGFPTEDEWPADVVGTAASTQRRCSGTEWPHNPASVYAGLADAPRPTAPTRAIAVSSISSAACLDYHLANGTTPADPRWAWPSVPYASADHGASRYRGAHDFRYTGKDTPKLGRGDGYGVIEPDKVAELGDGYLIGLAAHG